MLARDKFVEFQGKYFCVKPNASGSHLTFDVYNGFERKRGKPVKELPKGAIEKIKDTMPWCLKYLEKAKGGKHE